MESYKEKYQDVLEKARIWYQHLIETGDKGDKDYADELEYIFPELADSEDEKMRRDLIAYFRNNSVYIKWSGLDVKKVIEWLEKQGKKDNWAEELNNKIKELHKQCLEIIQKYVSPCEGCNNYKGYVTCVDGDQWAKITEAEKVNPKFKVGDFIVNDYCMGRVVELTDDAYLLDSGQGIPFSCHSTRLWDITKDAKDGDVLYSLDSNRPFIYKERNGYEQATAYCGLNIYGKFFVWGTKDCVITLSNYVPSTKEQRDLLFQKMKEAGYKWNCEEKKLVQIPMVRKAKGVLREILDKREKVPKQEWSEEDERIIDNLISELANLCTRKLIKEGTKYKYVNWLKSLRPQNRWKPSEEQLRVLHDAAIYIDNSMFPHQKGFLMKLYKQLKKLREE